MTNIAATIRRLVLLVSVLLLFAGLVAAALPRDAAAETAYVACAGVGDPADAGVCVPAPYPERLPLPY